MTAPLPLTILGGYLGAGKTRLVNRLLRDAGGRRIAVLVNDFGDLAVDADLIEAEGDDLIALAGGCVCCSYGDDLTTAIATLRALPAPPDVLLLEASGVAMPGAIGAAAGLMPGVTLAGIAVLADATRLPALLADRYLADTIERQVQAADLLLVTKSDLTDPAPTEAALARAAPGVPVAPVDAATPALVLARHAARPRPETRHAARHLTRLLPADAPTDPDALARDLAADPRVTRAKGCLIDLSGHPRLLQLVGTDYEITAAPPGAALGVVTISVPI
ncbi:CobW family GTP-binding protein [Jannaschia marina]|uniref:CobW family GTP-binding protein n=1 Tax=Jannaschia marina TaxID=2741674 RepID=UPI0015CDB6D4|nr:GTP-binding protein [Jannaschia marina]